jgi:hypothetical protein
MSRVSPASASALVIALLCTENTTTQSGLFGRSHYFAKGAISADRIYHSSHHNKKNTVQRESNTRIWTVYLDGSLVSRVSFKCIMKGNALRPGTRRISSSDLQLRTACRINTRGDPMLRDCLLLAECDISSRAVRRHASSNRRVPWAVMPNRCNSAEPPHSHYICTVAAQVPQAVGPTSVCP